MREVKRMRVSKEVPLLTKIVCNRCGREFVPLDDDYWWSAEVQSFSVDFGYGSGYDGERWQFDLCEDCLLALIRTFKVVPDGFLAVPGSAASQTNRQAAFEHWQRIGEMNPDHGLDDHVTDRRTDGTVLPGRDTREAERQKAEAAHSPCIRETSCDRRSGW